MGNPISHWELMVNDVAKSITFYSIVFDWEFDVDSHPDYPLISTGKEPGGGVFAKPAQAPMCSLNTYFDVEDVDATLAKATAAGASVIAPKTAMPGGGHWAMFADPDGIPVGIMQTE